MSDIVIKAENLSKQYRLGMVGTGTLAHDLNRFWAKVRGKEDPYLKIGEKNDRTKKGNSDYVWALNEINFEVRQGEVLGVIGRNGAGKSTLLKILSQITRPTTGTVSMRGRVGSLLEVGTGFHPDLTGRENIYINGAILGMRSWEIKNKLDAIIDFAGVEKYIDTPVKRYSSGMMVRLGFSVAAHLEPEILIIDEVLAVGDAEFQKKCMGKMSEVSRNDGRTILFVSHNMGAVEKLCSRAMYLSAGEPVFETNSVKSAIQKYLNLNQGTSYSWKDAGSQKKNSFFSVKSLSIVDEEGAVVKGVFSRLDHVSVEIVAEVNEIDSLLDIGYCVYDENDQMIYWTYQTDTAVEEWPKLRVGMNTLRSKIPRLLLNEGEYRLEVVGGLRYREWLYYFGSSPSIAFIVQGGLSESPYYDTKRPSAIAPICPWEVFYE
jgi:lipopolysaccharide transport system ATP-binding protein